MSIERQPKEQRWREPLPPREAALRRVHRKCQICKLPNSKVHAHRLKVLHLNGCKEDWSEKNVVLLCPKCYRQAQKVVRRIGTGWLGELFDQPNQPTE